MHIEDFIIGFIHIEDFIISFINIEYFNLKVKKPVTALPQQKILMCPSSLVNMNLLKRKKCEHEFAEKKKM